jgi:hypothetical protein
MWILYFSVVLFLDSPQQSIERVAARSIQQSRLEIRGSNIRLNFNESFKNVANYYFYFDQSDFFYTGTTGENRLIMTFEKSELKQYNKCDLQYPQKFSDYSFQGQRLNEEAHQFIKANENYFKDDSEHPKRGRSR